MKRILTGIAAIVLMAFVITTVTGCTVVFQRGRRDDVQRIAKLKDELTELQRAKLELERRLRDEIGDREVKVEMLDRGLVVTFVSEVLFDSGKAQLKSDALAKLDKVADVLQTTVRELNVGIEGHTDNVPIKHSGWKSNWELSSARAMSVLHHLIDTKNVAPDRLSATGYGEYRPVATNQTKEGRQQNRRVEIVILPRIIREEAEITSR